MTASCNGLPISHGSDRSLTLDDGRQLGYQVLGDPRGSPLFFFHGTPGSRLCLSADDAVANIPGLRLILPDRPGYGLSSEQPRRKINDWANDITELADLLQLDTFAVSGSSGGAPYALACGSALPNRVTRILLFNSACPLDGKEASRNMAFGNRIGFWTAKHAPWLLRTLIKLAANSVKKNPEANLDALQKQLPAADAAWMKEPDFRQAIKRDLGEAYAQGWAGHVSDAMLAQADWQIDFGQITQPVHIWHGELDNLSPIQNAKRMTKLIPNCQTRYLREAGHFLIDLPDVIADIQRLVEEGAFQ